MADDPKNIGGFSESTVENTKTLEESSDALNREGQAWAANTKAINTNVSSRQKWGRTNREQDGWMAKLQNRLENLEGGYKSVGQSVGGFTTQLMRAGSIASVYQRKLEAMRKGQEAFAGSMIATTGNTARAMEKSQQYVNAIEKSYASAHKMAGEFRVESETMRKAVDDLNARFATQIAASGNMEGAMEGMRREAFILGRYLGVEMTEVMDTWAERMSQTNMTLEEARADMIAVTHVADQYAKEIEKLGKSYQKTAIVGKSEFLEMVRDVGRELQTGTYNASAYARALKGVLVQGEKAKMTKKELKGTAEAMKNVMKETFTEGGRGSVFGTRLALNIVRNWDEMLGKMPDALRERVQAVKDNMPDASEIEQAMAIMNVMQGSGYGSAFAVKAMRETMGATAMRAYIKDVGGTTMLQANALTQAVESGQMEKDFMKKAAEEDKKGKGDQIEVWKKGIDDIVKSVHTPKDLDYKLIATAEEIKETLNEYVREFPIVMAAAQLGGSLVPSVVKGVGRLLAGKALLGGGATAAGALTTGGGGLTAGMGSAVSMAGVASGAVAIGSGLAATAALYAIDKYVGPVVVDNFADSLTMKKLGGDKSLKNLIGVKIGEYFYQNRFGFESDEAWHDSWELSQKEYKAKKKEVETIEDRIKKMENFDYKLNKAQEAELRALKKKKEYIEKEELGPRLRQEKQRKAGLTAKRELSRQRQLTRTAVGFKAQQGETLDEKAERFLKDANLSSIGTKLGQEVHSVISALPKEVRDEIGNVQEFSKVVQQKAIRRQFSKEGWRKKFAPKALKSATSEDIKAMTRQELESAWAKTMKVKGLGQVKALGREDIAAQREYMQAVNLRVLGGEGVDVEGGGGGGNRSSPVTTNARGQWVIQLPGQKLVVEGDQMAAANAQSTNQNSKG